VREYHTPPEAVGAPLLSENVPMPEIVTVMLVGSQPALSE
jgi:hypothetical protein